MSELLSIWMLVIGAVVGVLVGLYRSYDDVQCPCCRLHSVRSMERCPYCRCRLR
jgi:hypothetical protein